MRYKRKRLLYGFLIVIIITIGLYSRKIENILPSYLNLFLGDSLWALMIFLGFGFIFTTKETKKLAALSIIFCYVIELSQLYHGDWIEAIRKTTLGGLVLGYAFLWSDLIAYAIGIGVGMLIELKIIKLLGNYTD